MNIILVQVDGLRPDHLGCYGYARETSPKLDAFAREGALFEGAIVDTPVPSSSLISLLTATYYAPEKGTMNRHLRSLPERLGGQGYATGAIFGQRHALFEGTKKVFHEYFDPEDVPARAAKPKWLAKDVANKAVDFIEMHRDEPFFLFIQFCDLQGPYAPPTWALNKFLNDAHAKKHAKRLTLASEEKSGQVPIEFQIEKERSLSVFVSHYDACIHTMQHEFQRILESLSLEGLEEKTLVCFTSNHGTPFGEHGRYFRPGSLYQEDVHIPLILKGPGIEKKTVKGPVRSVDIVPTLLDAAGQVLDSDLQGVSLLSTLQEGESQLNGFSTLQLFKSGPVSKTRLSHAVHTQKWKYLNHAYTTQTSPASARHEAMARFKQEIGSLHLLSAIGSFFGALGSFFKGSRTETYTESELYDLPSDPGETKNMAALEKHRLTGFENILDAWVQEQHNFASRPASPPPKPKPSLDFEPKEEQKKAAPEKKPEPLTEKKEMPEKAIILGEEPKEEPPKKPETKEKEESGLEMLAEEIVLEKQKPMKKMEAIAKETLPEREKPKKKEKVTQKKKPEIKLLERGEKKAPLLLEKPKTKPEKREEKPFLKIKSLKKQGADERTEEEKRMQAEPQEKKKTKESEEPPPIPHKPPIAVAPPLRPKPVTPAQSPMVPEDTPSKLVTPNSKPLFQKDAAWRKALKERRRHGTDSTPEPKDTSPSQPQDFKQLWRKAVRMRKRKGSGEGEAQ